MQSVLPGWRGALLPLSAVQAGAPEYPDGALATFSGTCWTHQLRVDADQQMVLR